MEGKKVKRFFPLVFFTSSFIFTLFLLDEYLKLVYGSPLGVYGIVCAFFSYLFLFYYRDIVEKFFVGRSKVKIVFILLMSFSFSCYLWGGNLHAKWGLIDDHMIMHYFINNSDGVSMAEVPQLILNKTEVGRFGSSTINRPVYYSGRVFESMLWQKNVTLWYAARIVMFALSVAILWWLSQKWLGVVCAGIFTSFLFLPTYWGWIWGYLGPAENYAMFGCALYALGFSAIVKRTNQEVRGYSLLGSLLLLVGSLVAIGSKENFLFLLFPTIYLFVVMMRKRIWDSSFLIATMIIVIYCFFILIGIYLGLMKAGGDVYGQSIRLPDRLELIWKGTLLVWKSAGVGWILLGIIATGILLKIFGKESILAKYIPRVRIFLLLSLCLLILFVSQVFFYNGNFPPSALRYSFPGMLAIPFFGLLFFSFVFSVFRLVGVDQRFVRHFAHLIFMALLVVIFVDGYRDARGFVEKNVMVTKAFSKEMTDVIVYLKNHPRQPVVLDAYSIWNVEPIASIHAYLLADDIRNPLFLRLNFPPVSGNDPNHSIDRKISYFLSHVSLGDNCGFEGADWTFLSGGDCDQWIFWNFSKFNDQKTYLSVLIDESNNVSSKLINKK